MFVELNFSNPLMISSDMNYDSITVHVINFTDIFRSTKNLFLDYDSKNMTTLIKKQMIPTENAKNFLFTTSSSKEAIQGHTIS